MLTEVMYWACWIHVKAGYGLRAALPSLQRCFSSRTCPGPSPLSAPWAQQGWSVCSHDARSSGMQVSEEGEEEMLPWALAFTVATSLISDFESVQQQGFKHHDLGKLMRVAAG